MRILSSFYFSSASFSLFVLTLISLSGVAHAGESPLSGGSAYCQSAGSDQPKYFSGVFAVKTGGMEGMDNAFTQELIVKYGFKGSSTCSLAFAQTPLVKVKEDVQRQITQLRASGVNVVDTNWVYVPEAAKLARFCFAYVTAGGVTTAYVTDILQTTGSTTTENLSKTWRGYITKQHANAYPQCNLLPPGQLQQTNYSSLLDQWKAKNYKIERVAWNYGASAPNAGPDAATSPAPNAALTAAAAATAGADEISYYCYGYSADRKKQYVTPLAPLSVSPADASQYIGSVVMPAWAAYVHGELGQGSAAYANCGGGPTARARETRNYMFVTTPAGDATRVEIDWRYSGAAAGAHAASAPASGTAAGKPIQPAAAASESAASTAQPASEEAKAQELAQKAKEKAAQAKKKLRKIFGD